MARLDVRAVDVSSASATDLFFSGAQGNFWWSGNPIGQPVSSFFSNLRGAGHQVAMVRWVNGWYVPVPGAPLGMLAGACRVATVIKAVHDRYPAPKFNVIGSSAGGAGVAYSLANYGVASLVNKAVIVSGPPFMEIAKGCEDVSGYAYR